MSQVQYVNPAKIAPSPHNPRQHLGSLADLKASIEAQGILQPLLARERGGRLELIFGHRRRAAAEELGLKTVPVLVREMSDGEVLEAQLVENAQRKDVSPLDEAGAYRRLIDEFGYTVRKLSERVGASKSSVGERLTLLSLPAQLQKAMNMGQLDASLASAIVALRDPRIQIAAFADVTARQMSTRQAREYIRKKYTDRPSSASSKQKTADKTKARRLEAERLARRVVRAASSQIEMRNGFNKEELRLMLLGVSVGIDFSEALAVRGWEVGDTLLKTAQKAGDTQLRALLFESCVTGWALADPENVKHLAKAFRLNLDDLRAVDTAEAVFT